MFWKFITKTLSFAPARAGGPVAVVLEGVSRVFDDMVEDIKWTRDQMNPATCEDAFVPDFGKSRGIKKHPAETFEKYRRRVVKAWAWHRKAGRNRGIENILDHYGHAGCQVASMKPVDAERWAEFEVRVPADGPMDGADYQSIKETTSEAKAATAKLARLSTTTRLESRIHTGAGLRMKTCARI